MKQVTVTLSFQVGDGLWDEHDAMERIRPHLTIAENALTEGGAKEVTLRMEGGSGEATPRNGAEAGLGPRRVGTPRAAGKRGNASGAAGTEP